MKKLYQRKQKDAALMERTTPMKRGWCRKKHCLFAILHPKLYQIQNMKYHVRINPSGSAEAPARE